MDVDMAVSFPGVIDPSLASAEAFPSRSLSPAPPTDDVTAPDAQTSPIKGKGKNRTVTKVKEKAPKAKKAAPGSAADFRRREANRLAAERSRSRASEKAAALENARQSLADEALILKRQIAWLEAESTSLADGATSQQNQLEDSSRVGHESFENDSRVTSAQGDNEGAVSAHLDGGDHSSQHGQSDDHAQRQEQEAHSHTILAALTDITGVDFSEENDASWMQGMESFLPDSDSSGRLGELAAVASGANGENSSTHTHEQVLDNRSIETSIQTTATRHAIEASLQLAEERRFRMPAPAEPVNNAVTVLAAAINTEMERLIMEDLADTKAAIVQVEKQIAAMREGRSLPAEDLEFDTSSRLPPSILTSDLSNLSSAAQEVQSEISKVESDLPSLHEALGKLRDEKSVEVDQVTDVVKEMKTITIEDEEAGHRFIASLKSVGGLVESLLSEDKTQPDLSYASGTYSSPAIARRRRGRPPKGDNPRTFYQSFLLAPSSSTRSEHVLPREPKPKAEPKPKKPKYRNVRERLATRTRRSRLGQHMRLPGVADEDRQEKDVQEDLRQLQAHAQAQEQEREHGGQLEIDGLIDPDLVKGAETDTQPHEVLTEEADPRQGITPDTDMNMVQQATEDVTADAVNQAEAFILSQLDSQNEQVEGHDENDHRDHHIPPLDSTSFADFLPAQEELERQAGQEQEGQSDLTHETTLDTTIPPAAQAETSSNDHPPPGQEGASESEAASSQSLAESSVLARLRKGPPGSCDICMRTETTVWRKLSLGSQDLKVCNACGTYHHKFGVIRPPELWNDGKSIRRRRTNPRPSTASATAAAQTEGEEAETASPRPRKRVKRPKKAQPDDQGNARAGEEVQVTNDGIVASQSHTQTLEQDHEEIALGSEPDGGQGHSQDQVGSAGQELSEEDGRRAVLDAALIEGLQAIEGNHDHDHDHESVGDVVIVSEFEHGHGHEHDEGLREVVQAVQAARMAMAEHGAEAGVGVGDEEEGEQIVVSHDEGAPNHPEGNNDSEMASVFAI
ncbi:hypothetical protein I316_00431 [Kwoniella heveanensis BCC8398]|uniref:GATA-type domain-containing protein n=1 Tax=Kwoniella heveanensis BCC8398 TaxID=1296120 RepID=A0A1B9H4K6_9TREE|nr:hypothetical protein I316_00431 [Kwoniella heveanensis BCC8398]